MIRPKQLQEMLKKLWLNEVTKKRLINVVGGVGIGKSSIIKQVTDFLGWEFKDIRLALMPPEDLKGLVYIDKETKITKYARPDWLPDPNRTEPLVLFFDEFSNANSYMQNACLSLVLDRHLGDYKLPENTRVICAGNTAQSGAFVFKTSSAMINRCIVNVELSHDFEDWKEYAIKNNFHTLVISFHNYTNGRLLYNFNADNYGLGFATPRSWERVSELLSCGLENGILFEAIKGAVGEGAGNEFYGFYKIYAQLPQPAEILEDNKDIIPDQPNIMYALTGALMGYCRKNPDKLDRLIEYSLKIPKEFSVVLIKDIMKTELQPQLIASKIFNKWIEENKSIIL